MWTTTRISCALAAVLPALGCVSAPAFHGPVPVRNQHPAQLTVMHLEPRGASPQPAGDLGVRVDAAYTSLFLAGDGNGNGFRMDGEVLRTGLKTRLGLGAGFELDFELPLLHTTGGFLDGFVVGWHDLWGLPDQNRAGAPRGRFEVRARRFGTPVYEMEERTLALGDVPLALGWTPLPVTAQRPWGFGVRAGVELPTGDEDDGFGNGELDTAVGVHAAWRVAGVELAAQVAHTFAGSPDAADAAGVPFRDVTSASVAAELPLHEQLTATVQVEVESSTLRGLGFARVADEQWLLWTGLRHQIAPGMSIDLVLGEDLSGFVAPDFTAYLGLSVGIGCRDGAP